LDAGIGTYDVSSFTPYAPGEAGIQQILQGSQGIASLPSDLTVDEILASSLTTPEANLADLSTADLITPTAGEVVEPFDITDVVPATQELPQFSYEDMVPPSALPGYQPPASLGPSALDAGMGVYPTVPPQLEGLNALNAGMDVYPTVPPQLGGTDLSWMDKVSPSQMAAIGTGSLPGTTLGDKLAAGLGALGAKLATPQGVATAAMLAATAGDGGGGGAGGAGGGGGYGGAMPQYTLQRSIRPGVFDRTPYSTEPIMGRSFFTEPKYVPRETEMKAQGGILALNSGRYLRGKTDGMADKIPSNIDGVQPAALSHGEFVVPADVVSHLGNGNSDAGADVLYKMMDRVRKARTGTTKQGKQIDAAKYVPGGIVGFADGGVASSGVTATGGGVTGPFATSSSSTLSPWVAPSVTEALGRAEAFAFEPYKPYEGQLTATASPTQKEAFTAAKGLTAPSRDWSATMAQTYMNPYLEQVQKPLMSELDRQADIRQQAIQSEFTKAGAFGGARDVIARMENERNLQAAKAKLMGETQSAAFDQAMKMYGLERSRDIEDINAMLRAGEMERGVEGEGIKALQAQYEKEQAAPMERLTAYLNSLKGLPISTTATTPNLTDLQKFGLTASEAAKFYNVMETFFGPPKG
jgi:hypothetical protein